MKIEISISTRKRKEEKSLKTKVDKKTTTMLDDK